jgi:hypothetical protein
MFAGEDDVRNIEQTVDDAELIEGHDDPEALVDVALGERCGPQRLGRRLAIGA